MSMQEEMEQAKAAHAKRMAALRKRAAAEQSKIDAKMLAALRERHAEIAAQLEAAARAELANESAKRSKLARAAAAERQAHAEPVAAISSHGDADARRYVTEQQG